MDGLLSWIVFGLGAGIVARLVIKGPHNLGCIGTVVLGILGSIVGGTTANLLAGHGFELQPSGFIGACLGSIGVLAAAKIFSKR